MHTYTTNHYRYNGRQASGKRRMTRGQALLILFSFCLVCFILGGIVFSAEAKSLDNAKEIAVAEPSYKLVTVKKGDSIWTLAVRNHTDKTEDVRHFMQEIIELNQLADLTIYPGQNLKIPLN